MTILKPIRKGASTAILTALLGLTVAAQGTESSDVTAGGQVPLLAQIEGVADLGNGYKAATVKLQNTGQKAVWSVVLTGIPGSSASIIFPANTLSPGGVQSVSAGGVNAEPVIGGTVVIDFILFTDGTYKGPDKAAHGDWVRGMFQGRSSAISAIRDLLNKNDEAAVRTLIFQEPYWPEMASIENKSKYQKAQMNGYLSVLVALRSDLQARNDIQTVRSRIEIYEKELGKERENSSRRRIVKTLGFDEPVRFTGLELAGRKIELNDEFTAAGDWLDGLTVRLSDISGRKIKYISVQLIFPPDALSNMRSTYSIYSGTHPLSNDRPNPIELRTDGTIELKFDREELERFKKVMIGRTQLDSIPKIQIGLGEIFFEDGTAWMAGQYMKKHPEIEGRWAPVTSSN